MADSENPDVPDEKKAYVLNLIDERNKECSKLLRLEKNWFSRKPKNHQKNCMAFITMATKYQKEKIMNSYHLKKNKYFGCCSKRLKYELAYPTEPENIEWMSVGYSKCAKFMYSWISTIVVFWLIPVYYMLSLIIYLKLSKYQEENIKSKFIAELWSKALKVFFIQVFMLIARAMFDLLGNIEKSITKVRYMIKRGINLALLQVLILSSAASSASLNNQSKVDSIKVYLDQFFSNLFFFTFIQSLFEPIFVFVRPEFLLSLYKRYKLLKKIKAKENLPDSADIDYTEDREILMTQKDLNKIYSRPDCDIEERYSFNLCLLMLACAFTPFIPLISALCFGA